MFWKLFLMMVCILTLAVYSHSVSNRLLLKNITDENIGRLQATLDRDSDQFTTALYTTKAIPGAIEGTKYYDYIRTEHSDSLPDKYVAVADYLRTALVKQTYLQGTNQECLLYFPGTNSLCSRRHMYRTAEECFNENILYKNTDTTEILRLLRSKNILQILPVQEIVFNNSTTKNCMTLVIQPAGNNVTVMTIYEDKTILDFFGMDSFPEGSYLEITDLNGSALMQWPGPASAEVRENSYPISCSLAKLHAKVTVWVRKSYFNELMEKSGQVGTKLIYFTLAIGVILCFAFSRVSMKPIWSLVTTHGGSDEKIHKGNELEKLNTIISSSKQEVSDLQQRLIDNVLTCAFSGSVLTEINVQQLSSIAVQPPYRVVLIHVSQNTVIYPTGLHAVETAVSEYPHVMINENEMGLITGISEGDIECLRDMLKGIPGLRIGVSAPAGSFEKFHIALRQARVVLPHLAEIRIFDGSLPEGKTISWIQHERLYQSILSNDADKTLNILGVIRQQTSQADAWINYYNILFILRCVIDELQLPLSDRDLPTYNPGLLATENIDSLESFVRMMFVHIRERSGHGKIDEQELLLKYIQENFQDPNICLTSCADFLNVSERKICDLMKQASSLTFSEYLLTVRMKRATDLLESGQKNVKEVGMLCGYTAESTFFRVFKKYYGITPTQYRKNRMNSQNL